MVGFIRVLALTALAACLPLRAGAATADEILANLNRCGMRDPTGQTHLLALNGDAIVLRNQDNGRVTTTGSIPVAKTVFDFRPRSPNPEYGAALSLKCDDGSDCVEFKRADGFTWRALGFQVILESDCGHAADLSGKPMPR